MYNPAKGGYICEEKRFAMMGNNKPMLEWAKENTPASHQAIAASFICDIVELLSGVTQSGMVYVLPKVSEPIANFYIGSSSPVRTTIALGVGAAIGAAAVGVVETGEGIYSYFKNRSADSD